MSNCADGLNLIVLRIVLLRAVRNFQFTSMQQRAIKSTRAFLAHGCTIEVCETECARTFNGCIVEDTASVILIFRFPERLECPSNVSSIWLTVFAVPSSYFTIYNTCLVNAFAYAVLNRRKIWGYE